MNNCNVTNRVLENRLTDKSEYEAKHGIGPLTNEEIESILNEQKKRK